MNGWSCLGQKESRGLQKQPLCRMSLAKQVDISAVEKHLGYSYLRVQLTAKMRVAELAFP